MRNNIISVTGSAIDVRPCVPKGIYHHRCELCQLESAGLGIDDKIHSGSIRLATPMISCIALLLLLLLLLLIMLLFLLLALWFHGLVVMYLLVNVGLHLHLSRV